MTLTLDGIETAGLCKNSSLWKDALRVSMGSHQAVVDLYAVVRP